MFVSRAKSFSREIFGKMLVLEIIGIRQPRPRKIRTERMGDRQENAQVEFFGGVLNRAPADIDVMDSDPVAEFRKRITKLSRLEAGLGPVFEKLTQLLPNLPRT